VVDFINEVEEELRKDDYNRLLKKYGPAIGAVLFLIVAGAGFLEFREYSANKKAQAVSAVYTAADTKLDSLLDQAAEKFSMPRHKQLAQLKAAYLLADQGAYSDVIDRMGPLAETEAPYEFLSRELLGFAHFELGNLSSAREQFAYLTSVPGVPATVKQRAEQSMALMSTNASLMPPEPVKIAEPGSTPDSESQEDVNNED